MIEPLGNPLLAQVREGMEVYARDGKKIGKVDTVQFGEEDPSRPGPETATVEPRDTMGSNLIEDVAEALNPNDIPDTIRARLLRHGFIRVDPGLLASDRYIMAEQIAAVAGDRVELSVTKDDLISL